MLSQGNDVAAAYRQIGVTDNTYYRWRKEYGHNPQLPVAPFDQHVKTFVHLSGQPVQLVNHHREDSAVLSGCLQFLELWSVLVIARLLNNKPDDSARINPAVIKPLLYRVDLGFFVLVDRQDADITDNGIWFGGIGFLTD